MNAVVKNDSNVILHIDIKLTDGSVADSTRVNRQPAMIRMGRGDVTPQFELQLINMERGEKKSFTLNPEDAFGQPNPANIHTFPRTNFDAAIKLENGAIIEFEHLNGEKMPAIVRNFNDDEVTVDFNHPLCGQTLEFTVEVLEIQ